MIRLLRVPLARSPLAMLSSSLAASGGSRLVALDSRQRQDLIGLGGLEAPRGLVGRALAENDQVEGIARDLQAVFKALDQAEEDARRCHQQRRSHDCHQGRLPTNREVPDVVFERDHDVLDHLPQSLDHGGVCREERGEKAADQSHEERDQQPESRDVP